MGCFNTDKCCGCTDLRTGGKIIGIVGIILSILAMLGTLVSPTGSQAMENVSPESAFLGYAINIITSGAFLYGIYNNKSAFLLPAIILGFIGLIVLSIAGVIATVTTFGVALFIFGPIIFLMWHMLAVSYSLYLLIKDEEENKRPNTTGATYDVNTLPQQNVNKLPGVTTVPIYPSANTVSTYPNIAPMQDTKA